MVRISLGLAVGLRSVGPGSEVWDLECPAGDGVDRGAVGTAVVGDQALGLDAVAGEVLNGAAEESDRGPGLLIGEDFDVGQSGRISSLLIRSGQ
jgi:hypothetical protein